MDPAGTAEKFVLIVPTLGFIVGSFVRFYSKRAGPQGNYEDAAFRSLLTAEYCMSGLPSQCFFYTAQAKGADFNRGVSSLHTKKQKKTLRHLPHAWVGH